MGADFARDEVTVFALVVAAVADVVAIAMVTDLVLEVFIQRVVSIRISIPRGVVIIDLFPSYEISVDGPKEDDNDAAATCGLLGFARRDNNDDDGAGFDGAMIADDGDDPDLTACVAVVLARLFDLLAMVVPSSKQFAGICMCPSSSSSRHVSTLHFYCRGFVEVNLSPRYRQISETNLFSGAK